ncbi:calcium binding EGF domain protein, partial [Ostertagia ostertagi]
MTAPYVDQIHFRLVSIAAITPNTMHCQHRALVISCIWRNTVHTGIPGEWMFELGEKRVIRCKQGIKGDTCDEDHSAQCAPNAISFTDYDRCGEPLQRCQCLAGFKGDGYKTCHDIDECREQVCHKNAVCTNTPGRYFCQCQEGFSGDGVTECVASFLFPSDSHQPLPKSKTSKVLWQLKAPMKLFGKTYDKITVTTSGLLSITDVPKTFGDNLEQMHLTGVAPFFAPIDTSRGGHVTHIQENYEEPTFQARSVLIVTYMNVTDGRAQRGNTFQTLLINGMNSKQEKMTFAQMLYKDMQWGDGAEAAIMTNDISSSSVSLPGSGTQGIEQLTQLSNVGQPGIWLFRIDGPTIQPCPLEGQQPPYCRRRRVQLRANTAAKTNTACAIPVEPPRIIQPQLITPHSGKHNIHVSAQPEAPSAPSFSSLSSTPPTKTTRPRPRYESTPHRSVRKEL